MMDSLNVTFVNGETMSFPISPESTLSIETPDGVNGPQRGVVSEIVNVEYERGGAQWLGAPADTPQPAAEPIADVPEPAAPAAPSVEPETAGPVVPDEQPSAVVADESLLQKVEDKLGIGHDAAVAIAQTDVAIVTAPDSPSDPAAHLAAALTDIDVAIAAYPDSAELADLKSQLEAIQAEQPVGA